MKSSSQKNAIALMAGQNGGCLSCGVTRNMGRRRYCSVECRQRLRHTLNIRTGLLKALNTRYATFYFTEASIILDVLPYGSPEIFSFIYPRAQGRKPLEDFRRLADMLGNAWWAERRRTNKKYLAAQVVFDQARRDPSRPEAVQPLEIKIPSVKDRCLLHLKLGKTVLESPELPKIIKSAYRRQALKYHPDHGGNSSAFRRLHEAYRQLLDWAESPSFVRRRGFPDRWFYDGATNRWVQPTPRLP